MAVISVVPSGISAERLCSPVCFFPVRKMCQGTVRKLEEATAGKKRQLRQFSLEEVTRYDGKDGRSSYLVIDGSVYDVTEWLDVHPGGRALLLAFAGRDCSDEFMVMHGRSAALYLPRFKVGTLKEPEFPDKATREFRALHKKLKDEGSFEPQHAAYAFIVARTFCFLAAALPCLLMERNSFWTRTLGAVLLGLFWQQSLLFAHDVLHRSVFPRSPSLTRAAGMLFGGALGGIGAHWWNKDHSLHHMLTNVVGHDPSAGSEPFVYSDAKHYLSNPNFFGRLMLNVQVFLYFPLCLLVGRPYIHLLSVFASPRMLLDGVSLLAYFCWVGGVFASVPAPPSDVMALLVVSNMVCSVLHVQLNLNHYPTGMFSKETFHRMSYLKFQILTSMNVKSNWLFDWFHGGLQFQIEHHFFPMLPRNLLRKVSAEVKELVEQNKDAGLVYREEGFWEANLSTVHSLATARDEVAALDKKAS